ncbi:MAG: hypothetical protein WDO56_35115 [Gammaproteobacteria bacterium]
MRRHVTTVALLSIVLACAPALVNAGPHTVKGHTTKKGVYVPPHRATNPDASKQNNWSTKGNVNPYTGKPGTKNPTPPKK